MIAPIDAKASVEAEGGKVALTLNMRTLALAKSKGVNLLKGGLDELDPLDLAIVVQAFAVPDQPDFTDEQAFALLVRHSGEVSAALTDLMGQFAPEASKDRKRPPVKKGQEAPTS